MIDPIKVVDNWPESLDPNGLSASQKDGIEALIEQWNVFGDSDKRKLAYILATCWHETAKTMQPIEEWGKGAKKAYGKKDPLTGNSFYGRGHIQLTWKENYVKFGKLLKIDLVSHPENALKMEVSAKIAVCGCIKGMFTGKRLDDYFTIIKEDWVNARRVINGTDRALMIADYAKDIYTSIS